MINWNPIYLDTYIPELPKFWTNSFNAVQREIDIFYDGSAGILLSPLSTTGNVSGAQAQFVTGVFDNLIVKKQFTNLYENTTTIDSDFYNSYVGIDSSTRDASTGGSLIENGDFIYNDLSEAYPKINNADGSIAFSTNQLGQEFRLLWDASDASPFTILTDPSVGDGTVEILSVTAANSSTTWIKLIAVDYDASWGMAYTVKEYAGTYTLSNY